MLLPLLALARSLLAWGRLWQVATQQLWLAWLQQAQRVRKL